MLHEKYYIYEKKCRHNSLDSKSSSKEIDLSYTIQQEIWSMASPPKKKANINNIKMRKIVS